jgi:hypothetical protein
MSELRGCALHLAKKALAIAVPAIERQPGQFRPFSNQMDMKALLDVLTQNDVESERYARSAKTAVAGEFC